MRIFAILICLLPALSSASADEDDSAEDSAVEARRHYQAGLAAYRAEKYADAISELKTAYQLKPLPLLLVNIGATYRKMGDVQLALHFYRKYLDDAPDARDRGEIEATIQALEKQWAETPHAADAEPNVPEGEPNADSGSNAAPAIVHTRIEAAPPDAPVDVRASLPGNDQANLYVFYRQSGETRFSVKRMKPRGAEKVERIPASALGGIAMEYYLEARAADDQVIARFGSAERPNVVLVDPSAPPQISPVGTVGGHGELDDEKAPLSDAKPVKASPRRLGGVFWSGLVIAAVGAGGLALGIAGDLTARQQANALTHDSQHNPPYQFSDPTAPGCPSSCMDDASIRKKGVLWNQIGIAGTVGGGVLLGAGVIMMISDSARAHRSKPSAAKRRRDEDASRWYVAPSAGARQASIGGGFAF